MTWQFHAWFVDRILFGAAPQFAVLVRSLYMEAIPTSPQASILSDQALFENPVLVAAEHSPRIHEEAVRCQWSFRILWSFLSGVSPFPGGLKPRGLGASRPQGTAIAHRSRALFVL